MVVDLLFKLIDRCIQLKEHRNKRNRNLFTDFVEPIFIDFEKVHKDYVDSYRTYREMINKKKASELVYAKIQEDILFSYSARLKLYRLRSLKYDPIVGDFIESIFAYVEYGVYLNDTYWRYHIVEGDKLFREPRVTNSPRENFISLAMTELTNSANSIKKRREAAVDVVDRCLMNQQRNYAYVLAQYDLLKEQLLELSQQTLKVPQQNVDN